MCKVKSEYKILVCLLWVYDVRKPLLNDFWHQSNWFNLDDSFYCKWFI